MKETQTFDINVTMNGKPVHPATAIQDLVTMTNTLRAERDELRRKLEELREECRPVVEQWDGWKAWLKDSDEEELEQTQKISFMGVPSIAAGVRVAQLDALAHALKGEG